MDFSPGKLKSCMVDNREQRLRRNEEIQIYERTIHECCPVACEILNNNDRVKDSEEQMRNWRVEAILKIERELLSQLI
jgi:hypothetical protein